MSAKQNILCRGSEKVGVNCSLGVIDDLVGFGCRIASNFHISCQECNTHRSLGLKCHSSNPLKRSDYRKEKSMKKLSVLALVSIGLVMACLVLPTLAAAQGIITGSATGTVQDSSGAVVTGADITAWNTTTGVSTGTKSDSAGNFNFFALPIGTYQVTITGSGFASLKLDNVTIESGKATGLGIQKLEIGRASC